MITVHRISPSVIAWKRALTNSHYPPSLHVIVLTPMLGASS
jgi:hypothetical protein